MQVDVYTEPKNIMANNGLRQEPKCSRICLLSRVDYLVMNLSWLIDHKHHIFLPLFLCTFDDILTKLRFPRDVLINIQFTL